MPSKTNYLELKILDHVLRAQTFATSSAVYIGLFTAIASGEEESWTEVTGGSYARQSGSFSAPASASCANPVAITFPQATADWGIVLGFGVFDAVSSGNGLYWGLLGGVPQNFTAEATTDLFYATAHGYSENDRVRFSATPGGSLPGGIAADTDFYVTGSATDTFAVSAAAGPGTPVDITVDGSGVVTKLTPRTIQTDDTAEFASGSLVVREF
jgi:hypothetical protein